MEPICREAYERALAVMRKHVTQLGLSATQEVYEANLYTRDVMISSWGYLLTGDPRLVQAVRQSLTTLRDHQTELGQVPTVIWMRSPKPVPEYGDEDSTLWYIVAHWRLWRTCQDRQFLGDNKESLEKAMLWLRYRDHDEDGLIETHEGGNWADIFIQRYNVLSDNVLWVMALEGMAEMQTALGGDSARWVAMAKDAREKINLMFWIDAESPLRTAEFAPPSVPDVYRKKWRYLRAIGALGGKGYYLPFLTFLDCADYFDSLGNLLAILADIPAGRMSHGEKIVDLVLHFIDGAGVNRPYPVRCIYPPIFPGDKWWSETLRMGYAHREKANLPWQYHNGGCWPWMGGLYVAALVKAGQKEKAEEELARLAAAGRIGYRGEWRFNEWLHGETGKPMGADDQNWNAALYVFAYKAVELGQVPLFP